MRPTTIRAGSRAAGLLLIPIVGLSLAACTTASSSSTNAVGPPVLHLVGPGIPASAPDTARASGSYELQVTLPAGPKTAPIYTYLPTVTADRVHTLAAALHLGSATAVRHPHGWEVDGAGRLQVRDDGNWAYVHVATIPGVEAGCLPGVMLDDPPSGETTVSCSFTTSSSLTTSSDDGGPAPTATTAEAIAGPLARAAGLASSTAQTAVDSGIDVPSGLSTSVVSYASSVAGHQVAGLDNWIEVDKAGVTTAYGWLTPPVAGQSYPLISAATAYEQLGSRIVPEIAAPCPDPATTKTSAGACGGPTIVTGATLGLSFALNGDRQVLVPVWLFSVKGADPLSVIAIAPSFLASPTPAATAGTSGSGGGAAGSSGGAASNPTSDVTAGPASSAAAKPPVEPLPSRTEQGIPVR